MRIEDLDVDELERVQGTANDTMTRVILCEMEMVGSLVATRMLIVEPLTVEITIND